MGAIVAWRCGLAKIGLSVLRSFDAADFIIDPGIILAKSCIAIDLLNV